MKKVLLSLIVASGMLMADPALVAKAMQTSFNKGFSSQQSTLDAKKRLDVYYAEKVPPTQSQMDGMAFGVSVLPTLLDNSSLQGNMSSETLVKGCEFLISYVSQKNSMDAKSKTEMLDGCIIGYSSYLVNQGKLDLMNIAKKYHD